MKKPAKSKSPRINFKSRKMQLIGGVIVLLIALFLARGWIRMTALPKTIQAAYGNRAEKAYLDEMNKLQLPLELLGYTTTEQLSKDCHTVVARGISTQVDCRYDIRLYREVDTSAEAKKILDDNAVKLQALLQANGWEGEYVNEGQELTSLVKLITSITSGRDWQPDATYAKKIDDVQCFFHTNTAFAKPAKPAMATQVSCFQTYNILGEPRWY
jgi:hypothetical protein